MYVRTVLITVEPQPNKQKKYHGMFLAHSFAGGRNLAELARAENGVASKLDNQAAIAS
jgi:hypothetical protein